MCHLAHGKHLVYFSYYIIITNHSISTATITELLLLLVNLTLMVSSLLSWNLL